MSGGNRKKGAPGSSNGPIPVERLDGRGRRLKESTHRWWTLKEEDVHTGVFQVVRQLDRQDQARLARNLLSARLYGDDDSITSSPGVPMHVSRTALGKAAVLTVNVIKSCVDTGTTKIAQNRPRPLFNSKDGEASTASRAKLLTRYLGGVFYQGEAYAVAQRSFRDACLFGTGVVLLEWAKDRKGRSYLRFERVQPDEVLIDEDDGRYGEPTQVHRRKQVLRDRLIELFPDKADGISAAQGSSGPAATNPQADTVETVESWRLPSAPGAEDGLHSICVDGCTLFSEPWDLDVFPLSWFHWSEPVAGFWGSSLVHELTGIQKEINRICRDTSRAQRLQAQPRVFVQHGSQVVASHLNPGAGEDRIPIVKYTGAEPKFQTPTSMPSEVYNSLERWIARAYEVTGINQLSASGKKPTGVETGVALREYNDLASERFVWTGQRWENFFLDLAMKAIAMSQARFRGRKGDEDGGGRQKIPGDKELSVQSPPADSRDRFMRQIKWSDVDLDADAYTMQLFPTNLLPSTPAGKLETTMALLEAGMLSPEQGLSLLDMPDTERFVPLNTAAIDDVSWTIEQILDEGIPGEVDELANLRLCLQMGMAAALRAKRQGYNKSRQELLRRWVDAVREKLAEQSAPPPQDNPANDNGVAPSGPVPAPSGGSGGPLEGGEQLPVGEGGMSTGTGSVVSDPIAKRGIEPLSAPQDAAPAQMMDSIGGGATWKYKEGVPGEDPDRQQYGTTTAQLKSTDMGASMVRRDPNTGLEVIDPKEATGPTLAAIGNLNQRMRQLEGDRKGKAEVLPLMDSPDGRLLQVGDDGRAFYSSSAPPDDGRPSLTSAALPPGVSVKNAGTSAARPAVQPARPGLKRARLPTPDELMRAAERIERQMREDHEQRMAAGPAVRKG